MAVQEKLSRNTRSSQNGICKRLAVGSWKFCSKYWISIVGKFLFPLELYSSLLIILIKGILLLIVILWLHRVDYYCKVFNWLIKFFYRICHAHSWKFLKPHMFEIIRDVLFPILSYSTSDEELWNTDPYEYIRVKFGMMILIRVIKIWL